jgi:hypothetical protein
MVLTACRISASLGLALVACALHGLPGADPASDASASGPAAGSPDDAGRLTTLYASDPLACSLDLTSGGPGLIVQDGEVRNRNSHLALGYYPDSLAVAIQGGDTGAIVDLGTAQEIAALVGVELVGNGGNAFVALRQDFARGHAALQELASTAHAPIQVGHVYLARIAGSGGPDLFAKLLVLEFQPGASVTLRWQVLD